jgi:hypothetical protein
MPDQNPAFLFPWATLEIITAEAWFVQLRMFRTVIVLPGVIRRNHDACESRQELPVIGLIDGMSCLEELVPGD